MRSIYQREEGTQDGPDERSIEGGYSRLQESGGVQAEQEVRPSGDEPAHSTAQSSCGVGDGDSQEEHQSEEGIVDKNSLPNISMVFPIGGIWK